MHQDQGLRFCITASRQLRGLTVLIGVVVVLLQTGLGSAAAVEDEVPAPLADAVDAALEAWAGFATTGGTAGIESAFVLGGPQHRQLLRESADMAVADGAEPLLFTILELRMRSVASERATVWARVEATRAGFESQTLTWDFDLLRVDGRWQVWTVLEAPRPRMAVTAPSAEPPTSLVTTTSSLSTTTTVGTQPTDPMAAAVEAPPSKPNSGVRLPLLSAWIIVVSVVGVALAGYLAPRLDRRAGR